MLAFFSAKLVGPQMLGVKSSHLSETRHSLNNHWKSFFLCASKCILQIMSEVLLLTVWAVHINTHTTHIHTNAKKEIEVN